MFSTLRGRVLNGTRRLNIMENRALKILAAIVDEYIKTGEHVGSKYLMTVLDINVSSATIRNEMAALEQQGYLEHLHTSAGRIPTFKGYRLYIEKLMKPYSIDEEVKHSIDELLETDDLSDETIIQNASTALAEVTKCATFSMNSIPKFSVITKVEVIPTGRRMYCLLLITSNGTIKNKVCRLEFDLSNEQMGFFTRFMNSHLSGVNLSNLSQEMLNNLAAALGNYMLTLSPLLYAVYEMSSELLNQSVEVAGQQNLLTCSDFSPMEIVKFLEKKNELSALLDSSFSGINVLFGKEKETFVIQNSSLISAPYYKGDKQVGSLGIIGPMRLDYKRIIPYIEYFTNKVTNMLSEDTEDSELGDIEREVETDDRK